MRVYFDSSAFAKRYIDEAGTEDVLAWCDRADELALSVIAVPELISAFCRLQREGRLTDVQYQSIKNDFMADIVDAILCDTTPQVIQHAVRALENHFLRGMDAIHLGAAQACAAEVFISADARQCRAAEGLGLQVVAL
jgi:hypothetical protein